MVIKTFFYSMETTLISKKATLHVQHIFFVHLFAVVLDDYNVKLPKTTLLHVLWRRCCTFSRSFFFFTAAHFHLALVAASISYFVTTATKFSCCSSNKKCLALDLCGPFSRWASLACRLLYLFLCLSLFLLLVFSVTPFKIDQNKNQKRSLDKAQKLGNERR